MVMKESENEQAYHEAGHAIVGRLMPEHDPVYKVRSFLEGERWCHHVLARRR